MKKYLIYKTTNDINGMFYYGKHITENLNDSYLGSGTYLKRAIKKYGREHFHKEILFVFDNEKEMDDKEREIITEDLVKDPNCYNVMLGGEGGDTWSKSGRHHSNETKLRLSEISKQKWNDEKFRSNISKKLKESFKNKSLYFPDKIKEEYRRRGISVSKSLKGRSKNISESHKKSISDGMKKYYDRIGRKKPIRKPLPYKSQNAYGKMIKVYKENEEHTIYECDKEWYLNNGWIIGRNPSNKKPIAHSIDAKNSSSGKGKFNVHNKKLNLNKRIHPEELQKYLSLGWERGYLNNKNLRSGLERPAEGS